MDQSEMNRFVQMLLVRGEQLANIEGALGTARLLQTTSALLGYLCDAREWGTIDGELRAMRNYGDIQRICFARRLHIECEIPADHFIRRRVLLDALLSVCRPDSAPSGNAGRILEIKICALTHAEQGNSCEMRLRPAGDGEETVLRVELS